MFVVRRVGITLYYLSCRSLAQTFRPALSATMLSVYSAHASDAVDVAGFDA